MKNNLQAGVKQITRSNQKETTPSYAEQLKQAIYIKPKSKQMNSKTKQDVKENIDPACLIGKKAQLLSIVEEKKQRKK